ncbi:hypothetical protein GOBAR_DD20494 [Gossypium barbadense]|nr:hypothetical protein GOBAR_DD20494 [Gossypium barbadense]
MGNYVSCTLSTPFSKSSKTTKVILPSGEIKQYEELIKAAELMLETPNFFVVNSRSLKVGTRVNSTVTTADMGALFMAVNSVTKKGFGGKVRILPEDQDNVSDVSLENEDKRTMTNLNLDDIEEFSTPEFMHRLSMSRSKKPLLETIVEEPIRAR